MWMRCQLTQLCASATSAGDGAETGLLLAEHALAACNSDGEAAGRKMKEILSSNLQPARPLPPLSAALKLAELRV